MGRRLCVLMYIVVCSVFLRDFVCEAVSHVIVAWGFGVCGDVWTGFYLGVSKSSWCTLRCGARWCGF